MPTHQDNVTVKPALQAVWLSTVRTLVPVLVTLVVTGLSKLGIEVDSATAEQVVSYVIGAIAGIVYYFGVRLLEATKSSKFGWLLGIPNAPVYTDTDNKVIEGQVIEVKEGSYDPLVDGPYTYESKHAN